MDFKILAQFVMALTLLALPACGKRAIIEGIVKDNFSDPVQDVTVKVEGTTFQTTTNGDGKYSVEYIPGAITISYLKPNYTPANRQLSVVVKDRVPAEEVILTKLPPGNGIYLLDGKNLIPLPTGIVRIHEVPCPDIFWCQTYIHYALREGVIEGKEWKVLRKDQDQSKGTMFIVGAGRNLGLFKLANDGKVFRNKWAGTGKAAYSGIDDLSANSWSQKISYTSGVYAPGISALHLTARLPTGRYAFAEYQPRGNDVETITGDPYLLEVSQ